MDQPTHCPPHLLLLLIHCGLLAGEGAAGRGALSGELIAIGIMSVGRREADDQGVGKPESQQRGDKALLTVAAAAAAAGNGWENTSPSLGWKA